VGFIDLHSHVLPGLDDGSPDPDTSMTMLRGLASIGFEHVVATPHQKAGQFMPSADAISGAHADTRAALSGASVPLTLSLAAENMWDSVFFERSRSGSIPSYDGGLAFLVELPVNQLPVGLFDHMFEFQLAGKLPVLAHPERYAPLWKDDEAVDKLRASCALVVDLGAVAGYHGRKPAKMARRLLTDGIAHAAASDAHTPNDIRVAAEGIAWIRKKLGDAAVTRLLDEAPRRILAGEHPDA
jgi:protein-tyrosine phosphatase